MNFKSKKFKKLQMQWYRKLDKSGFHDIERPGSNSQKLYNERGAILWRPSDQFKRYYNEDVERLFTTFRQFSHHDKSLSLIDRRIIYMYGDGATYKQISNYLRRYFKAPKGHNPSIGKPYSIFFVQTRLKVLKVQAKQWKKSLKDEQHVYNELTDKQESDVSSENNTGGLKKPVEQ